MVRRSSNLYLPLACLFALIFVSTATAQDKLAKLESRFAVERDPVRKARAFPDLGLARLSAIREQLRGENYEQGLQTLQQYRDEARTTFAGLKQSGIDAEKKSNGFRQLEIHLRRGARQMVDLVAMVPFEQREPFETIRKELDQMDRELVNMLFPRQPGYKPDRPGKVGRGL